MPSTAAIAGTSSPFCTPSSAPLAFDVSSPTGGVVASTSPVLTLALASNVRELGFTHFGHRGNRAGHHFIVVAPCLHDLSESRI